MVKLSGLGDEGRKQPGLSAHFERAGNATKV